VAREAGEGRVLREGWPKYLVRLKEGALMVRFGSTDLNSVEEETRRLREMGLVEGVHFSVKMPEGAATATSQSLKRAWLSPPGSPSTAPANSGDLQRTS
jgi:hypothetical protein